MASDRKAANADLALIGFISLVGVIAVVSIVTGVGRALAAGGIIGLTALSINGVYSRMRIRSDHEQALQSHAILEIANESLSWLRQGLTYETAAMVCRIALQESQAAAVAITDTEKVLGFAGVAEDHHSVGGPIITRATHEVLEENENRILATRSEIGCPRADCPLQAAIVVPLEVRGRPVGTLKFYYTTPQQLDETQVAMVEGLGKLLSTQLELSELERQTELATRMELKALQAQINPHFLFNTINTIAALIRTDPPKARELLREFAGFYRRTLENSDELIPVETEIEYVRKYVLFEQARFGEARVNVRIDVPDALNHLQIPSFVVQPVVENAVQHGLPPTGTLHVRVTGQLDGDLAHLVVADDGVGIKERDLPRVLEPGFGKGLGIALKNVDDRLKGYFGPCCGLRIESREGHGTTVTLTVSLSPDQGK